MARIFDRKSRQIIDVTLDHEHGRDVPAARLTFTAAETGKTCSCVVLGAGLVSIAHSAANDRDLETLGQIMDGGEAEPVDVIHGSVDQLIAGLEALVAAQVAAR